MSHPQLKYKVKVNTFTSQNPFLDHPDSILPVHMQLWSEDRPFRYKAFQQGIGRRNLEPRESQHTTMTDR